MIGRGGVRPPGGGGRVMPSVKGLPPELAARELEKTARELDGAVKELSKDAETGAAARAAAAAAAPRVITAQTLPNATEVTIAHGLGRKPSFVGVSCPIGVVPAVKVASTGRVIAVPSVAVVGGYDEAKYVVLQADGWGVTIVVDVLVVP